MASWRELFKPWILERGREFFACGQVVEQIILDHSDYRCPTF